jgi:hypothetical protein
MTIKETQVQILKETIKCSDSKLKRNFPEDFEGISFIVISRGQKIISHRVRRETFLPSRTGGGVLSLDPFNTIQK